MDAVIREYERSTALILAAEDWPASYKKTPDEYGKMLRQEAKLQRLLLQYFRSLAERTDQFVNWNEYIRRRGNLQMAEDFMVDVLIEEVIDQDDNTFMQFLYDPIATGATLGAQSAEKLYKIDLGVTESTQFIQQAAKEQIAQLVGKRVDEDGVIRPNPSAKYHINSQTKREIRESINTSISLHEDIAQARERVQRAVKNPKRAEKIAQTEIVNAYNGGIHNFGRASGAVGKEWETSGAVDICADFARAGIVPLDYKYTLPSGRQILRPSAHPFCRCFERLVYVEELEN